MNRPYSISTVTLDYAIDLSSSTNLDRMYRPKATAVEVCKCPSGYIGLSCEVNITYKIL